MTIFSDKFISYIKLLLTAIFWGGTFVAGRALAGEVAPFESAFFRFLFASIILVVAIYRTEGGIKFGSLRNFLIATVLALLGVVSYNFFFFAGLELVTASRASLIIANNPVLIALLSALVFKDKLSIRQIVGIFLSLFGAVVVISRGDLSLISAEFGRGEFLFLGCVASWVSYSLFCKIAMKDISPMLAVTHSSLVGAVVFSIPSISSGMLSNVPNYSLGAWGSLFYLGFFGTALGVLWYNQGIKKLGPGVAGLCINFVPVSAVILAWLILGETPTKSLLIGGSLVVLGVLLTRKGMYGISFAGRWGR